MKKRIISLALAIAFILSLMSGCKGDTNMDNKFLFGVNIHRKDYESYPESQVERNLEYCHEMGLDIIRINLNPITEDDYRYINKIIDICKKYGIKIMLVSDLSLDDHSKLEDDYYEYFKGVATRLRGKIDYYQVFNELDVWAMHTDAGDVYNGGDGKSAEHYDPNRLELTVFAVRGALRGVKEGDPDMLTCVNFGWWHTYFLENLDANDCEWDITGCDWYSDAEKASSFDELQSWHNKRFPNKPMILCETNWWMHSGPLDTAEQEEEQRNWVREFTTKMAKENSKKNLQGIIYYELMDEPAFELKENVSYHGEAHFGIVACDRDGSNPRKKPVFEEIKNTVAKLKG